MIKNHTGFIEKILRIRGFLVDLVFPRFCIGCGKEGGWFCDDCNSNLVLVKSQICPECKRLSSKGKYCIKCRYDVIKKKIPGKKKLQITKKRKPLEGIITSAYYEEGALKELVHNFKYNSVTELTPVLGEMMAEALLSCHSGLVRSCRLAERNKIRNLDPRSGFYPVGDDGEIAVTFTPLHYRRLAQRGYNQAQLLAEYVGSKLGIPVKDLLIKTKATKRQVELQGSARRKNLKQVFKVQKSTCLAESRREVKSLKGKTIVIVDDVTTTGSTLEECAKVLKAAGAKEVWGLVVARG